MAVGGAQAIRACISAANNHNAFSGGQDLVGHFIASVSFILLRQEFHREMNSLQLAARNIQIAGGLGATA